MFVVSLLAASLAVLLTGCYSTRVQPLGPAEKVVEETPGEYLVLFPRVPSPERPSLVLNLMHLPRQKVKIGTRQRLYRKKDESKLLGAGLTLQWVSLVLAFKKDGPWSGAAIGLNLLGAASLLTRGRGGGYLGWFLPATIEKETDKYSKTVDRIAPEPVPVPGAEISVQVRGEQRRHRTNAHGAARIDLVEDLGLDSFSTNRAVALEIGVPVADYQQAHHFLPGEFLYPYYVFDRIPYFPDRRMRVPPASYTEPGKPYQVVERIASTTYGIALEDGSRHFLRTADARLVGYGKNPPASSPSSRLLIRDLRLSTRTADGSLAAGEEGFLRFILVNQSGTLVPAVEVDLSTSDGNDLEFTPLLHLGEFSAGEAKPVAIPLRAAPQATSGRRTLQIQVREQNGLGGFSREITLHIRAAP